MAGLLRLNLWTCTRCFSLVAMLSSFAIMSSEPSIQIRMVTLISKSFFLPLMWPVQEQLRRSSNGPSGRIQFFFFFLKNMNFSIFFSHKILVLFGNVLTKYDFLCWKFEWKIVNNKILMKFQFRFFFLIWIFVTFHPKIRGKMARVFLNKIHRYNIFYWKFERKIINNQILIKFKISCQLENLMSRYETCLQFSLKYFTYMLKGQEFLY